MPTSSPETPDRFDAVRAAQYDRKIRQVMPGYEVLHEAVRHLLTLQLAPQAHLLVAGAGTGAEIIRLGRAQPGWRFTAVDFSEEMLALCRQNVAEAGLAGRVTYAAHPVEALEATASFDAATSIFVAHFIGDLAAKRQYFQAIAGALLPGAPLVVGDLYGDRASPSFERLFTAWRTHYRFSGVPEEHVAEDFALIERHVSFVSEAALADVLTGAGFDDLVRFYQCYLWGAWLTRKQAA